MKAGELTFVVRADVASKLPGDVKKGTDTIGRTLNEKITGVMKGITGGIRGVASTIKGGASGAAGALGTLGGAGPIGAIVAAVGATLIVLNAIKDRIEEQLKKMEEASGYFKGVREMVEKTFNLALKPMADLMAMLMRPFLQLMLLQLRKSFQKAMPLLTELQKGGIGEDRKAEIEKELENIFKDTMSVFVFLQAEALKMIKPIAGAVEGFKAGADFAMNTFLDGIVEWVGGVVSGLAESKARALATISENIKEGDMEWNQLPESVKTQVEAFDATITKANDVLATIIGPEGTIVASAVSFGDGLKTALETGLKWIQEQIDGLTGNTKTKHSGTGRFIPNASAEDVMGEIDRASREALAGRQLGGGISETGMYMLHRGEKVLNRFEAQGSGGMSQTINVSFPNARISQNADFADFAQRISRATELNLRSRGLS